MDDSADAPGYVKLGDDYGRLDYGNKVFHVANVIEGTDKQYSDEPGSGGDDPTPTPTPSPSDPTPTPSSSDPTGNPGAFGTAATKPASKAASTTTPKTGDPLTGLGGLLSAAAVAGTAFAAYSARRVANEQGDSEEE